MSLIPEKRFQAFKRALHLIVVEDATSRAVIVYHAIVGSATFLIVWFCQPYIEDIGIPLAYFGVVWFVLHAWLGVISFLSAEIVKRVGLNTTLLMLPALIFLAYFSMSLVGSVWGLAFIFVLYFVRGVRAPLTQTLLQKQTTSDIRATTISVGQFASSLFFRNYCTADWLDG